MSEGLEQALDGDYVPPAEPGEEQKKENVPPAEPNEEQKKAASDGHMTHAQFVESGRSEDDYVGANVFNKQGSLMGQLKSLSKQMSSSKRDFEKRMEMNNKLHKQQMDMQISDLSAKRDAKIDEADREGANQIQSTIDQVRANAVPDYQPEPDVQGADDSVNEFNNSNPWIYGDTPKASYARDRFSFYQNAGRDSAGAIQMMQSDISTHFPDVNHRRQEPNIVQSGGGSAKTASGLTWTQLTPKELSIYNRFSKNWTKEDFLKSVADERRTS